MIAQKYFIKQFVVDENSFQNFIDNLDETTKGNVIIGYLMNSKEPVIALGTIPKIINLYLISKDKYTGMDIVSKDDLVKAWELFLFKLDTMSHYKYQMVFKNPPIEQWLDTKLNWCKKLAKEISVNFEWTFSDALSEIYLSIMRCYNKGTIYMGNLGYIKRTVYNSVLMDIRFNKKRLNNCNKSMCSLDDAIGCDSDGKEITLADIIPADDYVSEDSIEYQFMLKCAKELLSKSFSDREIEQIINQKAGYLPRNLYVRLIKWRAKHEVKELYE